MSRALIKNGRVYDGSGSPWYKADVLVDSGKIAQVGKITADAELTIDAEGLAIAPGFIDAHSHSDMSCLKYPDADGKLVQGVTTEIAGMCGASPAPLMRFKEEHFRYSYGDIPEIALYRDKWESLGEWISFVNQRKISVDMALSAGHGTLRTAVMGYANRGPTSKELDEMKGLMRDAMSQGALGLSTGLIYPSGCYAKTSELVELCKVVESYGGIYTTHMRNEADELIEALDEAISIGRESGVKVHVSHLKAAGKRNHGKVAAALEKMENARIEGIDITCDAYPYAANSSPLATLIPLWAREDGVKALLERLGNPAERRRIKKEILSDVPGWDNMLKNAGVEGVYVVFLNKYKQYEGKNLAEIGELRGEEPVDALLNVLFDENGEGDMICFASSEDDNKTAYKSRLTMVGSDSISMSLTGYENDGLPHPRTFGTFPRALGKYARDCGLFPLETAVWKMTGFPAARFGLSDRGLIMPGRRADMVVFNPETIIDNAVYNNPYQPPSGIEYVIMKGQVVVEGTKYNKNRLGRVIAAQSPHL